jgi:Kef-type K+ transport system membrane component KefB
MSMLLLVGFVALAEVFGLETILGAFLGGALLGLIDRDTSSHRISGPSCRPSATGS